ncbi:MAG: hypothetical protein EP330_07690 [Deltaproteobacteria bacterium]|nr:MAG: hypothetical protein EP330_07690 [Deltaproteobacteria bacterium]
MSQLDALLERSRTPGAFVTRKRFTLARHKAIEKMREFALRHPRQYVLELVQAAVFAGATWIAIDVRDDSILVGWVGGKTLSAENLENIFDYLFVDQVDLERRHLMQLAVGLNAIYQRKPSVVRIESGDGTVEGTARMELDRKGAVQVGKPEAGLGGTYLYVEFFSGWWERFFQSGTTEESRLVEERCLYTPVPILLNGSAPFGYRSNRAIQLFGVTSASTLDERHRRGALGVVRSNVSPQFRIVVGGVWVGTDELAELGPGLGGVIADDQLRKTADMSDLVRDERWVRMLHAVQPLATDLIRRQNPGYVPPQLPPMPEIREVVTQEERPTPIQAVAVPIEGPVRTLGPRPDLEVEDLKALEQGAPVFWVSRDQESALVNHADPAEFPFHVLMLSEGESVWLAEQVPGIALSRLATSADFGFVQRILTRRAVTREARVPVTLAGVEGVLTLRLHVEGRLPYWGIGAGVPALVQVGGTTEETLRLPLELGPVSVAVALDAPVDRDDLSVAVVRHTLASAWRLIDAKATDDATVHLLRSVLALHARPTFVELEGQKSIDAVLPNDWGKAKKALREAPLVATTEGPLSLDGLLALINEDRVATVRRAEDLDDLAQLEETFGPGHLHHPERTRFPLVAVVRRGTSWRPVVRLATEVRPEVVVGLRDGLKSEPLEGWEQVLDLSPVEVWAQPGADVDDIDQGLRSFADLLTSYAEEPAERLPETLRSDRSRAMMRLALLRLGSRVPVGLQLHATSGEIADLEGQGLMIAPLHGPQVVEHDTIALSFDELRALEKVRGKQVLRFDDPASVWHDLTEDGEGWLLRHEIRVPGVEGWIGLRFPYDPTAAILVETSRALLSLGEVDRQAPCHGLLWARSTTTALKHAQVELVRLAAIQLYQRLLEILDGDLVGLGREAAVQYAAAFALRTAARKGTLPNGTARELAAHVPMVDGEGVKWGSLERWLDADPRLRPPLPAAWAAHYRPDERDDVDLGEAADVPERIARRLRSALSALSRDVWVDASLVQRESIKHVSVNPQESTSLRVSVHLNPASPAVRLAHTEPRIFEMLLLEAARQVALWRDDHIHFDDLARMLVAQRLTA